MTKELEAVVLQNGEIVGGTEHIAITPYGVEFDDNHKPSISEWLEVVNKVQKVHGMMQFYLGDLMVFAETTSHWGESKYEDLIEATGYSIESLMQFTRVARRFPMSFRKHLYSSTDNSQNITWKHFQMVAPLNEDNVAKYYLEKVAEGRWTVKRLVAEIDAYKERKSEEAVVDLEVDGEGKYTIPTFNQAAKDMITWAKDYAKNNNADMIRIQVIKGGRVIDEKTTEVY